MLRLRWREWMNQSDNHLLNYPRNQGPRVTPSASLKATLKTSAASGSPLRKLSVFPLLLAMLVAGAQISRAQDATPPPATDQNQTVKRDSSTQPSGQGRLF